MTAYLAISRIIGRGIPRGGLPLRYARDLRPLAAIPLDAISASLHRPLRGTPRCVIPGSAARALMGVEREWLNGEGKA